MSTVKSSIDHGQPLGNKSMEQLIATVNQLQDAFTALGLPLSLNLPQIAVVGCQSAGKSSVLENIVGRDFLPRGSGIVTRRPLVLQLIHTEAKEYAEFLHLSNRHFTDFNEVRREIERETERLLGKAKTVSSVPINLRIYSPNVLDLTMIDLPGLTKNPIGEQPRDIVVQIRQMVMEYIKADNCLILAVSPANADLANSDALQIAREVDPQGYRTIGVITKLDLMDAGTDARKILENKVLSLRRGYIGVVNRSQLDIDRQKDVKSAILAEQHFFKEHPGYRHLAARQGTLFLQKALNQQLTEHIRERLPGLRNELQDKLMTMKQEVDDLRDMDEGGRRRKMNQLLHGFTIDFEKAIFGDGATANKSLNAGARINRIFHSTLDSELARLTYDEQQLFNEISYAIWNNEAIRSSLFTPHGAFEAVVRGQVERVLQPAQRCVAIVMKEILDTIGKCTTKMQRYPRLQLECERIAIQKAKECEQDCKKQLSTLTDMHLAYINTNHKDFIGILNSKSNNDDAPSNFVTAKPPASNQLLLKGYLTLYLQGNNILKIGPAKLEAWFVLTSESLSWYVDKKEDNKKFELPVAGLMYREPDGRNRSSSARNMFTLYDADGRGIYGDYKQLDLACVNQEEKATWRDGLIRAGVILANVDTNAQAQNVPSRPPSRTGFEMPQDGDQNDPNHRRRVEEIAKYVQSYMTIVHKAMLDMVPKAIMLMVINELRRYFASEFHLTLSMGGDDLMLENPEDAEYRENVLKTYEATEKALHVINEICTRGINLSANQYNAQP